jgi:hypothetical protein
MDFESLADELIEGCSGPSSLAMIYRFLLGIPGNDEAAAKAEFVKFLRGELSAPLLTASDRLVAQDRAGCAAGPADRSAAVERDSRRRKRRSRRRGSSRLPVYRESGGGFPADFRGRTLGIEKT